MRFEIRHDNHREEVSSEGDFVVFGRDPSCDIVVKTPRCSRKHASVRVVPEGFHLLDLGSSNGVYVLGQKVDDAIISEGDVFSMGDVFVRVLPEDMPSTIAFPFSAASVAQAARPNQPARAPVPLQDKRNARRPRTPAKPANPDAANVLGGSSVVVGLGLVIGPLTVGSQLGALAYALPILGVLSGIAGLGLLGRFRWARNIHYALFTIWVLTCLLAPFGIVGFIYQLEGAERPETDSFFAIVIGIAAVLAAMALVLATFLAGIYIPAPIPP